MVALIYMEYDVCFIGGGPGGYIGAIKAAHLGLKVALVEKEKVGGTCLLRGCIPTKTLIANSDVVRTIRTAKDFGVNVDGFSIDYSKMKARKDQVVDGLCKGVTGLVKAHGVNLFIGLASFENSNKIKVKNGDQVDVIEAKNFVIATGSTTMDIPSAPVDGKRIHNSTTILEMSELPKSLLVLGGGYIGCEFASLFAELGVKVTIIEFLPGIVWTMGENISKFLTKSFEKNGIELRCGVKMEKSEVVSEGVRAILDDGSAIDGDMLLVSIGRLPYTDGLNLSAIGLGTDKRGFIDINSSMETEVKGIYAIGDVTGRSMLAHVASHQAVVAAERIAGVRGHIDYDIIPAVMFTHPEIATVGLTLEQAAKRGMKARTDEFPFSALGKAQAAEETEGYAQIITEEKTGRILGAFMVGYEAGNMIAAMTLAIQNELTVNCITETIFAHPTIAESWMEVAFLAQDEPMHLPPKRKNKGSVK